METFTPLKFKIDKLIGISEKNIEEHLKLYNGYVTNANLVLSKIEEYSKDLELNSYVLGELYRRFSFEYNGVRNHEIFFKLLEGGPKPINKDSGLYNAIKNKWQTYETFISHLKKLATTRGVGWAMVYYDSSLEGLLISWVDEHHLGQLNGLKPILALDMWEHSYVADYQPSGKKKYVEDLIENINWEEVENNFKK